MSKIDKELTEGLAKCIEAALTDEAMRGKLKWFQRRLVIES